MTVDVRTVQTADVHKSGARAATLHRRDGGVEFAYLPEYRGPAVATTLPLDAPPRFTPAGSVAPYFAGLLPEGRRFTSLQRAVKASADDELSLLLAVGTDTVGDVVVVPAGAAPEPAPALCRVEQSFAEVRFAELLAETGTVDAAGLPGVQDKVSARVISLPVEAAHRRYILKLDPPEYPYVVENEAYFLEVARRTGLPVVDARVVHDADGMPGLLVTRFDRVAADGGEVVGIPCEDACQVLDRWPGDKYNVTSEELVAAVSGVCAATTVAIRDVYRQLCFAWLTGNGDVHAKNVSVLGHGGAELRVAPAYDLPSTVFYGDFSMALSVDGATTGLSRRRWLAFAESVGLSAKAAERVIAEVLRATGSVIDEIERGALPFDAASTRTAVKDLRNRRRLLES